MLTVSAARSKQVASTRSGLVSQVAIALEQSLGRNYQLGQAETVAFRGGGLSAEFDRPGLLISTELRGTAFLVLLPEALPLPDWYCEPGDDAGSRRQSLAEQLATALVSQNVEQLRCSAQAVKNLQKAVRFVQPLADSQKTTMPVTAAQVKKSDMRKREPSTLCIVGPVSLLPESSSSRSLDVEVGPMTAPTPIESTTATAVPRIDEPRRKRVAALPVTVAVQIAGKTMKLRHILQLAPGSIIPLDVPATTSASLVVGNRELARGEAVQVGQNYGIRIKDVARPANPS